MTDRKVQLGDVAAVFNGKTPSKIQKRRVGYPVLKIRDVNEFGQFTGPFTSFVDPDLIAGLTGKLICDGDTLVLNAAHNADYVASKIFFARNSVVGALATGEWLIIRPDLKETDPRFLYFWSQSVESRNRLRCSVRGIHLYPKDVADIPLALPDLSEQQNIAERLDQADHLRRTRRHALELTDAFLPAAFVELFGANGDRFPPRTVKELASARSHAIRTGPFGSQLLHSEFTDSGIAVLGIDNAVNNRFVWEQRRFITRGKYERLRRYTVFPGDVIITIMGTCGRCAIVPNNIPAAISTKHLCCITLDQAQCLPTYLHAAFLHQPFVRQQLRSATKGAIMEGLNMEIIKNLLIPLPPLSLQRKFAAVAERVVHLRAIQAESLRQAEHLFATLLHRAFST